MKNDFTQNLSTYQEIINRELRSVVTGDMPELLKEPIDYFLKLPGKRIRPLITLITAENFAGDYAKALPAAVAVEILHDFTLVHDDIMDNDTYRRGFETVHTKWDVGTALLSGDAMVAIAYKKLFEAESAFTEEMIKAFTDGMYVVCAGQALDKKFEAVGEVSFTEYMEMISSKTSRLISLAFELGYLSVTDDLDYYGVLKELGNKIGLAFQIQDDLLDFTADEKKLGKDVGSDWRQKKKTFITIGYKKRASADPSLPKDLFAVNDFPKVLELLETSGTLEYASSTIKNLLDDARQLAREINFSHPVLTGLLDFLGERTY